MKTTALSQSAKERGIRILDWHVKNVELFIARESQRLNLEKLNASKGRLRDFKELKAFLEQQ